MLKSPVTYLMVGVLGKKRGGSPLLQWLNYYLTVWVSLSYAENLFSPKFLAKESFEGCF